MASNYIIQVRLNAFTSGERMNISIANNSPSLGIGVVAASSTYDNSTALYIRSYSYLSGSNVNGGNIYYIEAYPNTMHKKPIAYVRFDWDALQLHIVDLVNLQEYVSQTPGYEQEFTFEINADDVPIAPIIPDGSVRITVQNNLSAPLTLTGSTAGASSVTTIDPLTEHVSTVSLPTTLAISNVSYTATITDAQNMKQAQVGSTIYSNFPATIPISANTTIAASGKDDPTITVNYTNTKPPVITNT